MPHITETLHGEHQIVEALFKRIRQTTGDAERTRRELFDAVLQLLEVHTRFEEDVFYPALRGRDAGAAALVDAAVGDHEEVEMLLDEIREMDPTTREYMDAVAELELVVTEHVRREEDEMFPLARDILEAADAERMSERHDEMARDQARAGD